MKQTSLPRGPARRRRLSLRHSARNRPLQACVVLHSALRGALEARFLLETSFDGVANFPATPTGGGRLANTRKPESESSLILRSFAAFTLLLTGADHWTTYQCLRAPIEGWTVVEANPLADWLFQGVGVAAGLAVDSLVTLVAIGFLVSTTRFDNGLKLSLLAFISLTTGYAVVNNLQAMSNLGLSPFSSLWSS